MTLYCIRVGNSKPGAPSWIRPIFTKVFIRGLLRDHGAKLRSMMTCSRQLPMILICEAVDNRAVARVMWALGEIGNVRVEVDRLY
jgi:hypothetical protein